MPVVEDFLNRLSQHIQAQRDRMDPAQATDPVAAGKFLLQMFAAPVRMGADTVGLGLEGTAKLGNYAAGEIVQPIAKVQTLLGDPNHPATIASQKALDAGPLHPQAALDALRNSGDTPTSWLAGALAMATDPANLIPLPAGAEANKLKDAAAVARKTAKFSDAPLLGPALPAGAKDIVDQLAQAAPQAVDPADAAIQAALAKLQPTGDFSALERKVAAAQNLPGLHAGVTDAQAALDQAPGIYKDVQAQKLAAIKDLKAPLQVGGRLPKGTANSPDLLQQIEDAKTAVTTLNPGGPQRGQTYSQFLQPFKAKLATVQAERDNAVGVIRNSLLDTGPSPVTADEAKLLSQTPATLPAGDLRGETVGELNARYNVMPGGPEDVRKGFTLPTPVHTEIDPNTGKAVVTDSNGWFKAEFDPNAVPKNPVAQEATVVANPQLAQDGSNPTTETGYVSHVMDWLKYALGRNTKLPADVVDPAQARSYLANAASVASVAAKGGKAEQLAANARPWQKFTLRDFASVWGGINVETPKNALILDPVYTRAVLANDGIRGRYVTQQEKVIGYRLAQGEKDPIALMGNVGDWLDLFGQTLGDETTTKLVQKAAGLAKAGKAEEAAAATAEARSALYRWAKTQLGSSGFDLEVQTAGDLKDLNTMQQALYGLVTQLGSPTRAVTGLLTAPLNFLIPFRSKVFHIINNVTHTAARVAAFEDAFLPFMENSAKDMLQRAAAEGKDVSLLQGKGFSRAGEVMATDGFFSPKIVSQMLGDAYGMEWEATVQQGFQRGFDNSKRVLGNFQLSGKAGTVENYVRKFVPFMSWSWRAYPRVAKYVLEHPAVGIAIVHLYEADRLLAQQEGRPGYQVGTLSLNKDTPLIGLLASVFTPQQESEVRVNPLALFSPAGGEAIALGMDTGNSPENIYQQATQLLGAAGGSFNPLIQTAAYITGADYKAPGNASRYSPIDQYLGHTVGGEVPTIQGPLRGARKAVTGVLPGGAQPDNYDPIEAKAKELVYEKTGVPLEQLGPTSQYAKEIAGKTGIYKQAENDLLQGGALKAAASPFAPVPLMVNTQTKMQERAAGQPPFSYDVLKAAKDQGLTTVVKAMTAANDQFYKDNPAAAVNRDAPNANGPNGAKVDPRVAQWEQEHAIMRKVAPKSYAKALADFKASLPK